MKADLAKLRALLATSLWWRRLTHRIDSALVNEAHIQAAGARLHSKRVRLLTIGTAGQAGGRQ